MSELLTAAFFMEGLHDAGYNDVIDSWNGGCIELVRELLEYVAFSEKLFVTIGHALDNGFPGIYDYEVSSPFGKWFGEYVIENGGNAPSRQMAEAWLSNAIEEFFVQCAGSAQIAMIKAVIAGEQSSCGISRNFN